MVAVEFVVLQECSLRSRPTRTQLQLRRSCSRSDEARSRTRTRDRDSRPVCVSGYNTVQHCVISHTNVKSLKCVARLAASFKWFIPIKDAKPWKQPLQERQANAVRMEAWPQMDAPARNALDELLSRKTDSLGRVWSEYLPSRLPLDEEEEKKAMGLKVG